MELSAQARDFLRRELGAAIDLVLDEKNIDITDLVALVGRVAMLLRKDTEFFQPAFEVEIAALENAGIAIWGALETAPALARSIKAILLQNAK